MFEIQPSIHHLAATPEQVISIVNSVNHPLVAVPGRTSQMAEAFVVALREVGDLAVVFVCLWLDLDREQVIYASGPIEMDELERVREEAIAFCESMGFIMEDTSFAELDRASQEELLVRLPPFSAERTRLSTSLVGEAEEVEHTAAGLAEPARPPRDLRRLGRMLARF